MSVMNPASVFVIIPAYNEAKTIAAVLASLRPLGFTLIVVDDGSSDETVAIAKSGGATVLKHPINLGQGAALQTGFDYARARGGEFMVTFDADGQYLASDIGVALAKMEAEKLDVVLGSRFIGTLHGQPKLRGLILKAGIIFTNWTTGLKLTDTHNGLRALRVATTMGIQLKQNRMAHASEILSQIAELNLSVAETPCTMLYTEYSMSKGQKDLNAVNILLDLMIYRLARL